MDSPSPPYPLSRCLFWVQHDGNRTCPQIYSWVVFVLPRLLEFMFKSMQEYAFGLILGVLDRKTWPLWGMLSLECDVELFVSDLELPPLSGVPLADYA